MMGKEMFKESIQIMDEQTKKIGALKQQNAIYLEEVNNG